jgi:hypothetical protein
MVKNVIRFASPLLGLLMVAALANAGGVDPKDMAPETPMVREKVSATPAQTSAAVSKARQAVAPAVEQAPVVKQVPVSPPRAKAVPAAGRDSWLLGSRGGTCEPLANVSRKVKNIGTFKTPQEFSRQMQQRGYQAFVLDIGAARDQEVRVKVPDLDLDLMFVRPELCR